MPLFSCTSTKQDQKEKASNNNKNPNTSSKTYELLQLRLSEQEKESYIELFHKYSELITKNQDNYFDDSGETKGVYKQKFPLLLGMIATDIAEEFAVSIFEALTDRDYILLPEYLKYVDIYHHGDQNERCLITFKLMDKDKTQQIKFSQFKQYLNLILTAIEKVQPSKEPLMSNNDIDDLFRKISNNKSFFTFEDFKEIFFNKPELISWIDYFKSNDEDLLGFLNQNVKSLLVLFFKFFFNINVIITNNSKKATTLDELITINEEKLVSLIDEIKIFNKTIKKELKVFSQSQYFNNIRNVFDTIIDVDKTNTTKNKADFYNLITNDIQQVRNEINDLKVKSKWLNVLYLIILLYVYVLKENQFTSTTNLRMNFKKGLNKFNTFNEKNDGRLTHNPRHSSNLIKSQSPNSNKNNYQSNNHSSNHNNNHQNNPNNNLKSNNTFTNKKNANPFDEKKDTSNINNNSNVLGKTPNIELTNLNKIDKDSESVHNHSNHNHNNNKNIIPSISTEENRILENENNHHTPEKNNYYASQTPQLTTPESMKIKNNNNFSSHCLSTNKNNMNSNINSNFELINTSNNRNSKSKSNKNINSNIETLSSIEKKRQQLHLSIKEKFCALKKKLKGNEQENQNIGKIILNLNKINDSVNDINEDEEEEEEDEKWHNCFDFNKVSNLLFNNKSMRDKNGNNNTDEILKTDDIIIEDERENTMDRESENDITMFRSGLLSNKLVNKLSKNSKNSNSKENGINNKEADETGNDKQGKVTAKFVKLDLTNNNYLEGDNINESGEFGCNREKGITNRSNINDSNLNYTLHYDSKRNIANRSISNNFSLNQTFDPNKTEYIKNSQSNITNNNNNTISNHTNANKDYALKEIQDIKNISINETNNKQELAHLSLQSQQSAQNLMFKAKAKTNTTNNMNPQQYNTSSSLNFTNTNYNNFNNSKSLNKHNNIYSSHNTHFLINTVLDKFSSLSQNLISAVKWIDLSYHWIEEKYDIPEIYNKEENKNITTPNIKNIHKNSKNSKNGIQKEKISNKLKTTDSNFKLLIKVIMGIQIACQNTPDINLINNTLPKRTTSIVSNKEDNNAFYVKENKSQYLNYLKDRVYTIEDSGSFSNETYLIAEHAPVIFNNIRKLFGISKKDYIDSISPQGFITELLISSNTIIEELFSTSKSGSMFFYTKDGKFIIKTLPLREYDVLKEILVDYFLHLKYNNDTLLPKYYGLYKLVKIINGDAITRYFITMENLFSTRKEISYRFDLKGSTNNRIVLKKKLCEYKDKISYALKDLDLTNNGIEFNFDKEKRERIVDMLEKDSLFLSNHGIIDYSLLVGIHYKNNNINNNNDYKETIDNKENKDNAKGRERDDKSNAAKKLNNNNNIIDNEEIKVLDNNIIQQIDNVKEEKKEAYDNYSSNIDHSYLKHSELGECKRRIDNVDLLEYFEKPIYYVGRDTAKADFEVKQQDYRINGVKHSFIDVSIEQLLKLLLYYYLHYFYFSSLMEE